MIIALLTVKIDLPGVHSLKEKRMLTKSMLARLGNKFNVSAIEADDQDLWQTTTLGIVALCAHRAQGDSTLDHILNFIEATAPGEVTVVERTLF